MPKMFKRNILSEEKKGSVLALLAERYSEHQVAFILKISKMLAHKDKLRQQTLGDNKATDHQRVKSTFIDRDDHQQTCKTSKKALH